MYNATCLFAGHLRRHKRIHLNEKSFVCHICGKGFNICNYLTIHMKRHTGEKPYNCEVCHKNFINSSKLKRHFRMHTGERPYSCNVCNKSFAQREYLNTHMRIHVSQSKVLKEEMKSYCFLDISDRRKAIPVSNMQKRILATKQFGITSKNPLMRSTKCRTWMNPVQSRSINWYTLQIKFNVRLVINFR